MIVTFEMHIYFLKCLPNKTFNSRTRRFRIQEHEYFINNRTHNKFVGKFFFLNVYSNLFSDFSGHIFKFQTVKINNAKFTSTHDFRFQSAKITKKTINYNYRRIHL